MSALHQTKCINHEAREAVARCPSCKHFFCRECITEHEGRVICASCLQKLVAAQQEQDSRPKKQRFVAAGGFLRAVFSLLALWILFYAIGQFLLLFPDSFHSGEMWKGL